MLHYLNQHLAPLPQTVAAARPHRECQPPLLPEGQRHTAPALVVAMQLLPHNPGGGLR